ncbi:hypothetical protein N7523_005397 [Penicillium sp. IBT 18751x]|nr:hypothetical protein N7523_005397 [Penicillium sp. IBT 18751x]
MGSFLLVAYNFGYCVASPVYGVLGDLFGKKNIMLWSYFSFMLGCIACGSSASIHQLILARALAGMSGAGMVSLVSVIMTDIMPSEDVVMYRNYANMVNMVGRALGAPIGGFLTQTVGWRWSFFGQIPLVLASILITAQQMPSSLNRPQHIETSARSKLKHLDFAGIIVFAAAVLSLLLMVHNFDSVGLQQSRLFFLTAGAFSLFTVLFLLVEIFWAVTPLIPLDLMKTSFGMYCISQLLVTTGRSAFMPTTVPYFVRVHNASDFEASLVNVIAMFGVPIGGFLTGLFIKRTNQHKRLGIMAASLMGLVYLVIFLRWRVGCHLWESVYLLPFGFTMGVLFSTQFIGMTSTVLKERLGQCVGTFYLFQQLGRIIGPVFGLKLINQIFKQSLIEKLASGPEKQMLISNILNDARFAFTLPTSMQRIASQSFLHGFQVVPLFCFMCVIFALPVMILTK